MMEIPQRHTISDLPDENPANAAGNDHGLSAIETRLEIALKALNAGVWEWDPSTDTLFWSAKCFEIFKLEPGPVTVKSWMSKVFPDDIPRVKEMWSRISMQAGWFDLEFRILVDKMPRWVRKSGYYLDGPAEIHEKVTGVMVDISDEKNFNDKLFDNQRFFKAIIEDQTELICRFRPEGMVTFANKAFTIFFGVSPFNILKLSLSEVFPTQDYDKILKLLKCIRPSKEHVNFEQRITHEDGKTSLLQWTLRAIFGKDEHPEEYQLVGRDVTEIEESREALRRSEEMFRLIAENSNDIISIHQDNGSVEYVSPSVQHILGYSPEELYMVQGLSIVCDEDYHTMTQCYESLQFSKKPVLLTFRLKDKQGKLIWFESMIQRQHDSKGESTGKVIAVSRNIHSRKIVEEQQKQTEIQLKEANMTKDKFFSIIAHDLRSPFTSILGFSRLLSEEYDDFSDEDRKMMVTQIQNSTETTFQLLDNLLAWAKTQLGRTIINPELFTLESLIAETVKQTMPQALIKNISLVSDRIEDVEIFADQNMIRTVLRNLVSNAVKFSFPGGTIELDSFIEDNKLTITVTDHGTGIPPEALDKLFNLSEQTITTKGTANEKGTGLGLILCREFIEKNGGSIAAKSEMGKGSTFSIILPINSPD